jgi:hypothetical protein
MSAAPIVLPQTLMYGPQPHSPALPEGVFGLTFSAPPALGPDGKPTVALFAAATLPGRYAEIYGGRAPGATEIVAIETRTGRVYHHRAERDDNVPLAFVMEPEPPPPAPEEAAIEAMEGHFTVDLRTQLMLPPEAGTYTVFLWLDEMTSGALAVPMPGAPAAPAAAPPTLPLAGLRFLRSAHTPQAPAGGIVLHRPAGDGQVFGAADPALLSPPPPEGVEEHLTVLGLDFRSRALYWRSFAVPEAVRTNRDLAFEFYPALLAQGPGWMDAPDPPRRAFLVACFRQAVSRVLVLEE